jgi:hypothetical protein
VDIFYLIGILSSSTFNFHLVNRMLITCESKSICIKGPNKANPLSFQTWEIF